MIVVVADAHIGEVPSTRKAFFDACDALEASRLTHFIVLGDLFRFFIGLKGWTTPEQAEVFDRIRRFKQAGVFTAYIEGNRDFFLKDPSLSAIFSFTGTTLGIEMEGKRMLLIHGDTLNRRDWRYQFWRRLSKSWLVYGITRGLPRPLLLPVYRWTEHVLKGTNFRYRKAIPLEALRAYALAHPEAGTVIVGHFHREFADTAGGAGIIGLPAFRDTEKFRTWEPGA